MNLNCALFFDLNFVLSHAFPDFYNILLQILYVRIVIQGLNVFNCFVFGVVKHFSGLLRLFSSFKAIVAATATPAIAATSTAP